VIGRGSGIPEDDNSTTSEDESNLEHVPSRFCVDTVNDIVTDCDSSSYRSNVDGLGLSVASSTQAPGPAGGIDTDQLEKAATCHSSLSRVHPVTRTSENPSNRLGSRRIKNLGTRDLNRPR
jgi:hypothetical protein